MRIRCKGHFPSYLRRPADNQVRLASGPFYVTTLDGLLHFDEQVQEVFVGRRVRTFVNRPFGHAEQVVQRMVKAGTSQHQVICVKSRLGS